MAFGNVKFFLLVWILYLEKLSEVFIYLFYSLTWQNCYHVNCIYVNVNFFYCILVKVFYCFAAIVEASEIVFESRVHTCHWLCNMKINIIIKESSSFRHKVPVLAERISCFNVSVHYIIKNPTSQDEFQPNSNVRIS